MTGSHRRALWALLVAGGGALAAGALAAADPARRAEMRRLRRFARRLDAAAGGVPNPPALPPGRTVLVPGRGEFFVRDTGEDAPGVLLLHGWGATADLNFFNAYPALAGGYRVVALDHRGHGRGLRAGEPFLLEDCADDAAALLDLLDVGPVVAVGYSMGGPIALLLAHRHPRLVAGLVLEATALEFNSEARDRALWRSLTLVEAVLGHRGGDGVVQRILREAIDKEPSLDSHRAWLAGEFRRGHVQGIVEAGRALSRFDARSFAAELHLPAAVVLTTADGLVAPRKQWALAAALGASRFELDGDHDAPMTRAGEFGAVTRAALDHVAGRAGLLPAAIPQAGPVERWRWAVSSG